jgi:hypothetical protein
MAETRGPYGNGGLDVVYMEAGEGSNFCICSTTYQ